MASSRHPACIHDIVSCYSVWHSSGPLPPLAPLPLPLLSHFSYISDPHIKVLTQDWCYSNNTWAKLSKLPAHEIGHCEHALWDALEWHLWVDKTPCWRSEDHI